MGWSQTVTRGPEFDVISIRLVKADRDARPKLSCVGGTLLASDIPAQFLIEYAYGIRDTFPLPDWARPDGDRYDVQAKSGDSSITAETCKVMTQHLLEGRFQLKLRREVRETDVYFLTVAKGGMKLKPVSRDGASTDSGGVVWLGQPAGTGRRLPALVVSLNDLPDVGRRVIDKTGLSPDVFYTFRFDYIPGQSVPDVFEALEMQLGLKLAPGKAPFEFFVADQIARPSPN